MSDFIDRDAVLSLIEEQQRALCPAGLFSRHSVYGSDREKFDAWGEIIDAIQAIPTVDSVKHGRWIDTGHYGDHHMLIVQCSECKNESEGSLYDKFCPECGAKMDLEQT